MRNRDTRAMWIGVGVAVAAAVALTVAADSLESALNSPGKTAIAEPVLWAVGGGLGLCIGAGTAAWLARRAGPGVLASAIAAVPLMLLLVLAYNDKSLRLEDQVVGTLIVVVLPGFVASVLVAMAAAFAARLLAPRAA